MLKIPSGGSVTGEIDLRSRRLLGLQAPAAWTAADLTVLARVTTADVPDGSLVSVPAPVVESALGSIGSGTDAGAGTKIIVAASAALLVAGRMIVFSGTLRDQLAALPFVTFRSTNTASAAAVNQGADRYLWAVLEPRGV